MAECHYTSKKTLIYINCFAVVAHFTSGSLGYFVSRNNEPSLTVQAPLIEFVQNGQSSLLHSIPKTIFNAKVFQPVIAVEFITGSFHVIYLFALIYPPVDSFIKRNIIGSNSANALRWIEYSITASTMSAFGNLNLGITDFYYFVRTYSEGFALQTCGFLLEILNASIEKDVRIANIVWNIGTLLNIAGVGILLYQLFASKTHTNLFYYNVAPFAIWFNSFGVIAWLSFKKYKQFADIYFAERWYIILSLCTKISVFWLGFSTFKQITEENGFSAKTAGVNWKYVRYTASYALLGVVALIALRDYMQWYDVSRKKQRLSHRLQQGEFYVETPFEERRLPKAHKKKQAGCDHAQQHATPTTRVRTGILQL